MNMKTALYITALILAILPLAAFAGAPEATSDTGGGGSDQQLNSILEWDRATGDWWGHRTDLEENGITFEASIIMDWSKELSGGIDTEGSSFRHLFDANLTVETEPLLGWEGGTFFIDFYNHHGDDGAAELTGDLQGFCNIDADGRTQIAELWYQQMLFEEMLRIKFGKVEANSEFDYADNAGEFINSSAGCTPTIHVFPTYPDPSTALVVFGYPTDWFYGGFGWFDGAVNEGYNTGELGPSTFFQNPGDYFLIGEAGVTWDCGDSGLAGRLAAGVWAHTGTFTEFDGSTEEGTEGFYLVLDQALWLENAGVEDDEQGLYGFMMYGYTDDQISEIEHHIEGGLTWTGPIPTRDDDATGLLLTYVELSDEAGAGFTEDYEMTFETFYKIQLTPYASVKPDLQYIINPGGGGIDDALVGSLRMEVVF